MVGKTKARRESGVTSTKSSSCRSDSFRPEQMKARTGSPREPSEAVHVGEKSSVSTKNMSREEWLERRRLSIGGSDAAAIIGLNPYASAYTVWADKTGRLPDKPDNEAMRQGRDFEDYVAARWCEETGKRVRRVNAMRYHAAYPFAHADVDRWVVGEPAGLECKTTSVMNLKQFKDGAYPEQYYVQCVHYMAVTGAERWYLGVLVLGQGFYTFVIERDEEEIRALMETEAAFWEHVETDVPPVADGSSATTDALSVIYADSDDEGSIELFGRERIIREYMELKDTSKALERRMEEIKQNIMQDLGEHERGSCGGYVATWKQQSRRSFDVKRFCEDYPGEHTENYWKTTKVRSFHIKELK